MTDNVYTNDDDIRAEVEPTKPTCGACWAAIDAADLPGLCPDCGAALDAEGAVFPGAAINGPWAVCADHTEGN